MSVREGDFVGGTWSFIDRSGDLALSGQWADVDETYVGGKRPGKRGRGAKGKSLVVIAVEKKGRRIGRIRLSHVQDAAAGSLVPALCGMVAPGRTIRTDGWLGYSPLPADSYSHVIVRPSADLGENLRPACHRVASLLKRWLLGTQQAAVRPEQLAYYLDEFTFLFNRRTSASRGKLFMRLVQQAIQVGPVPYKDLTDHNR